VNRTNSGTSSLKKQIPVILAAFTITFILAFGMFGIGSSAVTNKNGVAVSNSPNTSVSSTDPAQTSQAQIDQLQSLVTQYQQREQQYQQREQQLQSQISTLQGNLDQANGLLQQYQRLVQALVDRGIIQVDQQGRIYLP
jgi:peptidoglycan hydrolase CwlO-like protein